AGTVQTRGQTKVPFEQRARLSKNCQNFCLSHRNISISVGKLRPRASFQTRPHGACLADATKGRSRANPKGPGRVYHGGLTCRPAASLLLMPRSQTRDLPSNGVAV